MRDDLIPNHVGDARFADVEEAEEEEEEEEEDVDPRAQEGAGMERPPRQDVMEGQG